MARKATTEAPAEPVAKKSTKAAAKPTWGISELVEHINTEAGTSYDGYNLRIVLRKLVKDGVLERGEGRYSFTGANDPQVKAILKAIKSGAAEKAKAERLDNLKASKATKGKPAAAPKASRSRKAAPKVEEPKDDDDLLEDLDD